MHTHTWRRAAHQPTLPVSFWPVAGSPDDADDEDPEDWDDEDDEDEDGEGEEEPEWYVSWQVPVA